MEITFEEEMRINPDANFSSDPLYKRLDPKVITIEQYDEAMNEAGELLREEYGEHFNDVSQFQYAFMRRMLTEYARHPMDDIKNDVYELMAYAVNNSETGNTVVDVDTEEQAKAVEDELWNAFGWAVLDCEVYHDSYGDYWYVDVMVGGSYVPEWDGWRD